MGSFPEPLDLNKDELVTRPTFRTFIALAGCVVATVLLAACGGSGGTSSGTSSTTTTQTSAAGGGVNGGIATVDMGQAPDSLDPQYGYTTQSAEADWIVYTPLLTYAHADGQAGSKVIPGLATALPVVSDGGRTYTLTLRHGLTYSNGAAAKASDFTYAIERMLRLDWGGDSFFTQTIKGALAYSDHKAASISGISTDNATGKITIHLTAPYGAFDNLLAFPSAALVPPDTAMHNLPNDPPPGIGAYIIKNVVPNESFDLVKNPRFAGFKLPGIPTGHLNEIKVTIASNTSSEAELVLENKVDNFDAGDSIPASLLSQIKAKAAGRFSMAPDESTYYMFMNQSKPPFNNQLVREAVNLAVNRTAFERLGGGELIPGCYLLPTGIIGHPTKPCPWGTLDSSNVAKAKQLVQQAHDVGAPVTVWGESVAPVQQWVQYYTSVLNSIGLKASIKTISSGTYFPTIGAKRSDPQTGYSEWLQDFPNPVDFYLLVNANSIQPLGNRNRSYVRDPHIQKELAKLDDVPTTKLSSVSTQWSDLDYYVAQHADELVFGYGEAPKFLSDRINYSTAVFSPISLNDWSSWELKQ
jgi:peptide/nickel transport system substrate-binding protein